MMKIDSKRRKFQKQHREKNIIRKSIKIDKIGTGVLSIYNKTVRKITEKQMQATINFLRRKLMRNIKITTTVLFLKSITKKPNETRLGKGKGNIKYWSATVFSGSSFLNVHSKYSQLHFYKSTLKKLNYKFCDKLFLKIKDQRWIL